MTSGRPGRGGRSSCDGDGSVVEDLLNRLTDGGPGPLRSQGSVQRRFPKGLTPRMHTKLISGAVAAAGLGLTMTALAVSPADAATVTLVRSADLIKPAGTTSGTTGTAKADFLAEGIHIKTDNTTDAARGY